MKLNAKDILKPSLILFVICLVAVAALVGTNALTEDKIAKAQLEVAEQSRKVVLPEAEEFEQQDDYYIGKNGSEEIGFVFETESKGYGGTLRVMTGIDVNGNITGVVILSHGETPGLGANAQKESFTDKFKQAAPRAGLKVVKNKEAADGEIEAMTGATITTKAVTDAVNIAIEKFEQVKGGA